MMYINDEKTEFYAYYNFKIGEAERFIIPIDKDSAAMPFVKEVIVKKKVITPNYKVVIKSADNGYIIEYGTKVRLCTSLRELTDDIESSAMLEVVDTIPFDEAEWDADDIEFMNNEIDKMVEVK